jgi:hypothetical protein
MVRVENCSVFMGRKLLRNADIPDVSLENINKGKGIPVTGREGL